MSSLLRNLKATKPWEWLILALALGLLIYSFSGCASLKAAEDHGTQLAIGAGVGVGVGVLAGGVFLPVLAAAAGGAVAAIFAQPPCPPQTLIQNNGGTVNTTSALHPMGMSTLQMVITAGVLYVLWIRRRRVMAAIKDDTWRGTFAHLSHAFLGTRAPHENPAVGRVPIEQPDSSEPKG